MLDQLLDIVKQNATQAIINNKDIPNEKNDLVIQETTNSITSGLQNVLMQSGGVNGLLGMFSGRGKSSVSSGIKGMIIKTVANTLMKKFGFSSQQTGGIVNGLVENVLGSLVHKTNDPKDSSLDLQGIFNSLSCGKTQNVNVNKLAEKAKSGMLDLDGDGDTDLQDLMGIIQGKKGASKGKSDDLLGGLADFF